MDENDPRRAPAGPASQPRFAFAGLTGAALYIEDLAAATDYYAQVLGPPAYVEGEGTRGWRIGDAWLTLLRGRAGGPRNVELVIEMRTPDEAERLQTAFIEAGGTGEAPSDQTMYEPLRYCPVTDPFGTTVLIVCPLQARR